MKKKSEIQIAEDIISSVKREMNMPRLTESVRRGLSNQPEPPIERFHARSVSA
jgi:hypothetical protein